MFIEKGQHFILFKPDFYWKTHVFYIQVRTFGERSNIYRKHCILFLSQSVRLLTNYSGRLRLSPSAYILSRFFRRTLMLVRRFHTSVLPLRSYFAVFPDVLFSDFLCTLSLIHQALTLLWYRVSIFTRKCHCSLQISVHQIIPHKGLLIFYRQTKDFRTMVVIYFCQI